MIKNLIWCSLFFTHSLLTHAQAEPLQWSGRANFGGFVTQGNVQKTAITLDGLVRARTKHNRFVTGGEFRFAEDEGIETEDELVVYSEYDHFFHKVWFAGGRISYETDDIESLDRRIKAGPYAGIQYFESDPLNLASRLGLDYIDEEYESGITDDDVALTYGVDYDQRFFDKSIQVFYKHDLSVPASGADEFLFDSEAGVRFPVANILTGTAQINFDWDNDPPQGIKQDDTTYAVTLGYEF